MAVAVWCSDPVRGLPWAIRSRHHLIVDELGCQYVDHLRRATFHIVESCGIQNQLPGSVRETLERLTGLDCRSQANTYRAVHFGLVRARREVHRRFDSGMIAAMAYGKKWERYVTTRIPPYADGEYLWMVVIGLQALMAVPQLAEVPENPPELTPRTRSFWRKMNSAMAGWLLRRYPGVAFG